MAVVTADNIYQGAIISNSKGVQLTVYKVNSKTFYAGSYTMAEFNTMKDSSGLTFTNFCKSHDIKSLKYSAEYSIEDSQIAKKELVVKNSSKKSTSLLSKGIKKLVTDSSTRRLATYEYENKIVRVIAKKDDCVLMSQDEDYILYDPAKDETASIGSLYAECANLREKFIPWNKLSKFVDYVVPEPEPEQPKEEPSEN